MAQPPYLYPSMAKPSTGSAAPFGLAPSHTTDTERDAMLCRYPSKVCENQRSEKRGGGLHRFCAYHRERANINQRRVDHRRRLRRQGMPVPPIDGSRDCFYPLSDSDVKQDDDAESDDWTKYEPSDASLPTLPDLSDSELHELMQLLEDVDVKFAFTIKDEAEA